MQFYHGGLFEKNPGVNGKVVAPTFHARTLTDWGHTF